MRFKIFQAILIVVSLLSLPNIVYSSELNNKFGIHLAQPHFEELKSAADLVNSSGGDWGYVTLVMQDNDLNKNKWQDIFDRLRGLHLIPIIRLATHPESERWVRPKKEEAENWADFLNSLNWVVKNRYVVLFNEPNHGQEWGGEVDAKSYSDIAFAFSQKLKEKSPDFFVMLAGFDASSPSYPPNMEDEETFLKQIPNLELLISNYVDGWASHSYPNPNFSGSPWDRGRGTVRTYQWELGLLGRLGVSKELPVFITETGWKRGNENTVSVNFKTAFENIWLPDSQVMAVTPFVLDYQGPPFLEFSWKRYQNNDFYPQYSAVQAISKIKGNPSIVDRGELEFDFPGQLLAVSSYHFKVRLKNTGQAIWDKLDNYELRITDYEGRPFEYFFSDIKNITPFQESEVDLYLKTGNAIGKNKLKVILSQADKNILESKDFNFEIVPLPSLKFNVSLFPKLKTNGNDFELQIFDAEENLVFKKSGLRITDGQGQVEDIQNIIPGKKYRLVLLKPYYLPRQEFIVFKKGENKHSFKIMLPLDFDNNGHLDWGDLIALIKNPALLRLFNFL